MHDLPHCIQLALWVRSCALNGTPIDEAVAALSLETEPHRVFHVSSVGSAIVERDRTHEDGPFDSGFHAAFDAAIDAVAQADADWTEQQHAHDLAADHDPGESADSELTEEPSREPGAQQNALSDLILWLVAAYQNDALPHVILAQAGRASSLPGPAAFNRAVLESGQCLLFRRPPWRDSSASDTDPHAHWWGLLVDVQHFGSVLEPGTQVQWLLTPVQRAPQLRFHSLSEADQALRQSLIHAVNEVESWDAPSWRRDARDALADTVEGALEFDLPPGTPARAAGMLQSSWRLQRIIDAALAEDHTALGAHSLRQRENTLRELQDVAAAAMTAAASFPY